MKQINLIIVFLLISLLLAGCLTAEEADCMSIYGDGSVLFDTNNATSEDLSVLSLVALVNINSFPAAGTILGDFYDGYNFAVDGWIFGSSTTAGGTNGIGLEYWFSGGKARWQSTNAISTGRHLIAFSYDRTSLSNVPALYVDGVAQTVSTVVAPTGTPIFNSSAQFGMYVNTGAGAGANQIYSASQYNRILSAAEHADAFASRLAIPTYNGLVFAPQLCGISGAAKDGDTMTASNQITDLVSGIHGTPVGSPVFYADNYLIWQGE